MEPTQPRRERLDVPILSPLERRLQVGPSAHRPHIAPVPKSSVLGRLQQFIPNLAAANDSLQEQMKDRPQEEFDIENAPEDGEGPYIEMDLACGLFDLKDESSIQAAERAMQGTSTVVQHSDSSDDDDSSTSSSSDDDELPGDMARVTDPGCGSQEGGGPDGSARGTGAGLGSEQVTMDVDEGPGADQQGAGAEQQPSRRKVAAKRTKPSSRSKIVELA